MEEKVNVINNFGLISFIATIILLGQGNKLYIYFMCLTFFL